MKPETSFSLKGGLKSMAYHQVFILAALARLLSGIIQESKVQIQICVSLNLLHLTPYYAPAYAFGGVVRAVEGMCRALAERGHTVTVLTTDARSSRQRYAGAMDTVMDGVRVVRVPNLFPRGALNLSTPRGMRALSRDLVAQADIIHTHEFRTVENLLVMPLAASQHKPLVLSPHGTLSLATGRGAVKAAWDALFSPAVARRFNAVIGLTAAETADARAFWSCFGSSRAAFHTIPNGVALAEFESLPPRSAFRAQYNLGDAPICLFLGRLHPRKGAHLLAQAFHSLNLPDARLVVAGPDEGGLSLIQPYVDDRVILTGYLDAQARLEALATADVFALPAVGEGLSIALLEALAAGLPVLLTPGCNLPEVVEAGAGIEVSPEPDALAEALELLLTNHARRAAMGAAARRLIRAHFTWESVAARLEAVYTGIRF